MWNTHFSLASSIAKGLGSLLRYDQSVPSSLEEWCARYCEPILTRIGKLINEQNREANTHIRVTAALNTPPRIRQRNAFIPTLYDSRHTTYYLAKKGVQTRIQRNWNNNRCGKWRRPPKIAISVSVIVSKILQKISIIKTKTLVLYKELRCCKPSIKWTSIKQIKTFN